MIRHLLKLVWNRKRVNALILTEIILSFLVLFAVVVMAAFHTVNFRKPLGFSIERVWSIAVDPHVEWTSERREKVDAMVLLERTLREMPEIEAAGGIAMPPYSGSTAIHVADHDGRKVEAHVNGATDGAGEVLRAEIVRGRWFSAEDDAATARPAVVNEQLARDLWGTTDVVGRELPLNKGRIVGIVRDFRKAGEFSTLVNYVVSRIRPGDTTEDYTTYDLLLRTKPGVKADFQERLVRTLEETKKGWTFSVTRLDRARKENFEEHLNPLIVFGIIAGFLLFMVALGLIGVLWQTVSRRTREIGLRRALGGTAQQVYRQILGELLVLTTFGLAVGTVIIVQVPLLDLIPEIPAGVYAGGLALSIGFMYLLTLACGLYPSLLTMEIRPAEALHYE